MKKVLTIVILVSIVGTELLVPIHTARAGLFDDAATWGVWTKEFILDPLAKILANKLLRMLGNDVINYIQGGGEPRFVQNIGKFVKDAADAAAGQFITDLAGVGICQPFNASINILVNRVAFPSDTFNERVACTASEIFADLDRFRNDFRNGGWATWIQLYETRNTLLGASLIANDELARAITKANQNVEEEIRLGQGFFNQKSCSAVILDYGPGGTETVNIDETLTDSAEWNALIKQLKSRTKKVPGLPAGYAVKDAHCAPSAERIVTPGNLIGDQVSTVLGKDIAGLIAADELGEVVSAIIDALINRGVREGLSLMKTGRGAQTAPSQGTHDYEKDRPAEEQTLPPPVDNPAEQTLSCSASPTTAVVNKTEVVWSFKTNLTPEGELAQVEAGWRYQWRFDERTFDESDDVQLLSSDDANTATVIYTKEGAKGAQVNIIAPTGMSFQYYTCISRVIVLTPEEGEGLEEIEESKQPKPEKKEPEQTEQPIGGDGSQ